MTALTPAHKALPRRFSGAPRARRYKLSAPMSDMNVTPFIDVLLVLLIMIILAVPIKNHIAEVDLPSGPCRDCTMSDVNTIVINAQDQLYWNGTPVTPEQLRTQVTRASTDLPEATLRFEPDALASYDRAAKTIVLMKEAGAPSFAFVGNAKYKDFGR
ncbi:MAG: biopolymer transporter ExbD [Pseudomonadota bacterium]